MAGGRICNGPYLLAPGARQMTVAWEAEVPADFYVVCSAPDGTLLQKDACAAREPVCPEPTGQ